MTGSDGERDWRVSGELGPEATHRSLASLIGRDASLRGDVDSSVPKDVVVTHDGERLFAYAADSATIEAARRSIETALARDGVSAALTLSHWDPSCDEWVAVGPEDAISAAPPAPKPEPGPTQTRTLVATAGREIRVEFEQVMSNFAAEHGIGCEIVEHPHLLTTQVAFHVTGPAHKLDEFAAALKAEGWATILTETSVMTSPL
jgi:hypothetical protein